MIGRKYVFDDTELLRTRSNQRDPSPRLAQVPQQPGIIEHSLSAGCAAAQQLRIIEHNPRGSLGLDRLPQQVGLIQLKSGDYYEWMSESGLLARVAKHDTICYRGK